MDDRSSSPEYPPNPTGEYTPPQQNAGGDYRPGSQPSYAQPTQPVQPPQYGGGDYQPQQQSQYGSGSNYPPQQQPQPYYTGGPPATPPRKKGVPVWAWLVPLIVLLLAAGGLGTWAYKSAQDKADADAHATSTSVAQARATSTAQAQANATKTTIAIANSKATSTKQAQAQATFTALSQKAATTVAEETVSIPIQSPDSGNADLLKAAAANMKAAKSYHIKLTASQGGTDVTMDGDVDLVNNSSRLDMLVLSQAIKVITIGSDSYLSVDGGTTYIKSASSLTGSLDSFIRLWDNFQPDQIDRAKSAIKDGQPKDEVVGSDPTHHMTASSKELSSLSDTGATEGTIDMWVTTGGTTTMRKMKVDAVSSDSPVAATIEWTNINQAVTIEAPPTTP